MPDLAKAYVQIIPSAKGISSGIKKELGGEMESAGSSAGKSFASYFSSAALGAGVASAALAVGAAVGKAVQASVTQYADYEQLVGGVETLFQDSAGVVQNYARQAYQTAGLSANQYMQQVTSFSASLISSLGGDTAKAAEMGNMAIVDMADNVNKMGSSMESVQNAYQGFAKQNYTMLDNLKLGYGGTKSEMERLLADAEKIKAAHGELAEYSVDSFADIVEAIHVVQEEMGITGTTAQEAEETISGSLAMTKAAWGNLMTGMADDTANTKLLVNEFADSAIQSMENILPAVGNAIEGTFAAVGGIFAEIGSRIAGVDSDARNLSIALEATAQSAEQQRQGIESNAAAAMFMTQQIENLAAVENKDALQKERLTQLVQSLNELMPGLNLQYDQQTDSLNMGTDAIEEYIQAQAKLAAFQVYQDELTALYKTQADAWVNLAAKTNEASTAQETYNNLLGMTNEEIEEAGYTYTTYDAEVTSARIASESAAKAVGQAQTAYNEASKAVGTAEEKVADYADALGLLGDAEEDAADGAARLSDEELQSIQTLSDIGIAAQEARYSSDDLRGSYEELQAQLETLDGEYDENLMALVEQQLHTLNLAATNQELIEGYPQYISALQDAGYSVSALSEYLIANGMTAEEWGSQVDSATDGVINSFNKLDTDLGMSVEEMASNLQANIQAHQEWSSNIGALMAGVERITDESTRAAALAFVEHMQEMGPAAAVQVAEMAGDVEGTLATFAPLFEAAAQEGIAEVTAGFEAGSGDVSGAAGGIMTDAQGEIEGNSLEEPGEQKAAELADGITAGGPDVSAAAESVVTEAQAAISDVSEWRTLGSNMAMGIANGVGSAGGAVANAVRRIVSSALAAGQDEAQTGSPSRRFADELGAHLPTGVAMGIEENMQPLLDASEDMMRASLLSADQVQLQGVPIGLGYGADGDLSVIVSLLQSWLPELASRTITIDGDAAVGAMAPAMDTALGVRGSLAERGLAR